MANELKVEVFAVGKWNGLDFAKDDLQAIVMAYNKLGDNLQVPLKFGHNDEQPFTDGQPALGWVTSLELTSENKLLATFSDVPDIVYDAMSAKLYRNVSIELEYGVEYKGDYYPWVLSGVALLGADIPAVNVLSDLQAYMSKDITFKKRVAFTTTQGKKQSFSKGGNSMDIEELKQELANLKTRFTVLEGDYEKAITENADLKKKLASKDLEFKTLRDAEEHRKGIEKRNELAESLDEMVKNKMIAPFSRDEYLADYDAAENKDTVMFAVEKLKKTIESNPTYFGAEQARRKAAQDRHEDGKRPDQIVKERTEKYMLEHGEKNFSVAKRLVLKADRDLAEAYKMGGA